MYSSVCILRKKKYIYRERMSYNAFFIHVLQSVLLIITYHYCIFYKNRKEPHRFYCCIFLKVYGNIQILLLQAEIETLTMIFLHGSSFCVALILHLEIISSPVWLIQQGMNISSPDIWLAGKPRTIEPWCVTGKKSWCTEYFCIQHRHTLMQIRAHTRTRVHSKTLIWPICVTYR